MSKRTAEKALSIMDEVAGSLAERQSTESHCALDVTAKSISSEVSTRATSIGALLT